MLISLVDTHQIVVSDVSFPLLHQIYYYYNNRLITFLEQFLFHDHWIARSSRNAVQFQLHFLPHQVIYLVSHELYLVTAHLIQGQSHPLILNHLMIQYLLQFVHFLISCQQLQRYLVIIINLSIVLHVRLRVLPLLLTREL